MTRQDRENPPEWNPLTKFVVRLCARRKIRICKLESKGWRRQTGRVDQVGKNKTRARESANMLFLLAQRSRRVLTRSISACECSFVLQETSQKRQTRRFCDSSSGFGLCHRGKPITTSCELYHANSSINSITIDFLQLPSLPFFHFIHENLMTPISLFFDNYINYYIYNAIWKFWNLWISKKNKRFAKNHYSEFSLIKVTIFWLKI